MYFIPITELQLQAVITKSAVHKIYCNV